MNEAEALRLYALALSLIPEPNAAGDLFLLARDEADLRRRAAAWRRREGLPEAAEMPLPALDAEQQELALLLVRRSRRQRRLRPWLALGAGGVLVATLLLSLPSLIARTPDLVRDPAFDLTPASAGTDALLHLSFAAYRAEATPGSLTVWWAVSGPGAAHAGPTYQAALQAPGGGEWLKPVRSEIAGDGRNRLVGRSTFTVANLAWPPAVVSLRAAEGHSTDFSVRLPVVRVAGDPDARSITLGQTLSRDGVEFTLEALDLAPNYTALRYHLTTLPGSPNLPPPVLLPEASRSLPYRGAWPRPDAAMGEYEGVYDPVPEGADRLAVLLVPALHFPVRMELPLEGGAVQVRRDGGVLTLTVPMPAGYVMADPYLVVDAAGRSYTGRPLRTTGSVQNGLTVDITVPGVPPDARPLRLTIGQIKYPEPLQFTVDLPQGLAAAAANP